jgi:hypothetical protein
MVSALHTIAASTVAQCFVGAPGDENLSIILAHCHTTTAILLPTAVPPSLPCLANWLQKGYIPLRAVAVNMVQYLLLEASEEQCLAAFADIQQKFTNWSSLLPFAFIVARRTQLPPHFCQECCSHLFPVILNCPETLELFVEVFARFIPYFSDGIVKFFSPLVAVAGSRPVTESFLIALAIQAPVDFFNAAAASPNLANLLEKLFQRWSNPDRQELLSFLTFIIQRISKYPNVDFEKVFHAVTQRVAHVGNCRAFLVFGCETGEVIVIGKDPAVIMWRYHCSKHPVALVSVSPNGQRFVVLCPKDKLLIWIATTRGKQTPFERIGEARYTAAVEPAVGVWQNESVVSLQLQGQVLLEVRAPNASFFDRFR